MSEAAAGPDPIRTAALAVLTADGRGFVLRAWQVAYLMALTEGREGHVPPGCGAGAAWLRARIDQALGEIR